MTAVQVSGLTVSFNGTTVLHGIDLAVPSGGWVGVIGPNGSGKSTLLRALGGTVPFTGAVEVGGTPIRSLDERQRSRLVALVAQRPVIPEGFSVADYVFLGRSPHLGFLASEGPADLEAVGASLAMLDLTDMAERRLPTLSGGELQRAILARAIAQQTPVLLLDEPTTSLDLGHQQQALELVEDLRRERELTVVAAIHDLTLAAQFCDRLVMLADGRVVGEGSPEAVLTEQSIGLHYGADVSVQRDPGGGIVVLPLRHRRA
jgi:iron complex transport system ATP-binding protein